MLGASHASFGTSILIMPLPASAVSVVAGKEIPQACSVPVSVLPLAVYTTLPQTCSWPSPRIDAVPAGQLTLTTRCDASVNAVRGSHGPASIAPVPPVPPPPPVPAAPSDFALLLEQAPASARSAPSAIVRRPLCGSTTRMRPRARGYRQAHPLANSAKAVCAARKHAGCLWRALGKRIADRGCGARPYMVHVLP